MCKKLTITTILLILMCITVSFSWMMDVIGPAGNFVKIHYDNNLYVSSNELEITMNIEENGEYIPLYHYAKNSQNSNERITFTNKGPGDTFKFELNIKNTSDLDIYTSIVFADIVADHYNFLYYTEVGLIYVKGYEKASENPAITSFMMAEKMKLKEKDFDSTKTYSVSFLENLRIPVSEEGITIKFYLRLSTEASNELQEKNFTIGSINFISI